MKINKKTKLSRYIMIGNPFDKICKLSGDNKTYEHSHTQRTTKIKHGNSVYYYGGNDYSFKEFNLQRKLKKDILKNIEEKKIDVPYYNQEDIKYMVYSNHVKNMPLGETNIDIVEYDINMAYYQCAYNLGYMSKDIYDECISLPKHKRLRFIGTIATFKRKYVRQGWKILEYTPVKDELLRRVWFHICRQVDDCLTEFMRMTGDNFLLYYVDGVYLKKGDYTEPLKYLSKKYGFDFKKEKTMGVERVYNNHNNTYGLNIYKYNKSKKKVIPKKFTFKKEQEHRSNKWRELLKEDDEKNAKSNNKKTK